MKIEYVNWDLDEQAEVTTLSEMSISSGGRILDRGIEWYLRAMRV